jgi:circadian clock protein KaiB
MDKLTLKLFVAGHNGKSERAIHNLRHICDDWLKVDYELIIVDVLESPHLADQEHILATPTLIKLLPLPTRRLIGDLSDTQLVLRELDLSAKQPGVKRRES